MVLSRLHTIILKTIDYLDIGGYVWKDHVIDRDFELCESFDCDYKTFIENICGRNDSRVKSMRFHHRLSFCMDGKNLSYSPAVILNDEVISDFPQGGSGKGLYMNALSHMKKVSSY